MQVRDEIEHLLDDDDDMAEMYLTEKLEEEQELENSSTKEQDIKYDEEDWYYLYIHTIIWLKKNKNV